jgi:hypothetical protein
VLFRSIKTDDQGFFEVWFGDSFEKNGGYDSEQKFDITITKGAFSKTINNLTVYAPLFPVDETNNNTDLNKTLSNYLGQKFENHVTSIVPSAAPHNIIPYDVNTNIYNPLQFDFQCNKVISNKLAYQMWTITQLVSGGTLSIDTSAARYHLEYSPTFIPSGGIYYTDITHNFNNQWPLVAVWENDKIIVPEDIVSLVDRNTIRVFLNLDLNVDIVIIG